MVERNGRAGSNRVRHPETQTAQALGWIDETTRALIPPMHAATTYQRDPDNAYSSGYSYSRTNNPTYAQVEALLCELEGGAGAMVVGSGQSAAALPFLTLSAGDHVVAQSVMYWGIRKWLIDFCRRWRVDLDFFDSSRPDGLQALMRPGRTRLVWTETPSNPMWDCIDIAAAAEVAHAAGARLCVDSTCSTPVLTQPLALGADLVMHSATKYLNGHSDVIAGALVTAKDDDWWQALRFARRDHGTILGPQETWLLLRGMRTLHLRVARQCASAMAIARHFEGHPKLSHVLYPGLESHPSQAVARRQMHGGFGGMKSIRVRGGLAAAVGVAARLEVFKRATSLGGVESLVEHRASIEGEGTPVPDDLLRLSVGIEHADDLIADLEQALAGV